MKTTLYLAAVAAALVPLVDAHVGRGMAVPGAQQLHEFHRRSLGVHNHMARAAPTNAKDVSTSTDPTTECKPYGLPDQDKVQASYPTIWKIANLLQNDTMGQQVWKEIQKSGIIPSSVQVKQQTQNHMGISQQQSDTYPKNDPDCWWTASTCTKPKSKSLSPDMVECPEPSTWGLSFDDGPNCSHNAFYDFLQQEKLKATLFYIGSNVADWPLEAQRGLADGHDICVHTWSHHYMTTLTSEQVFAELFYTARMIKDVTGVTVRCWRPPYGDVDDRVRAIATGLGLRTILWSDDTNDWNIQPDGPEPTASIDANYQKIISKAHNKSTDNTGVIVLAHELTNATMSEFIKEYPKIKKAYKHITPLTACYNATTPYAEDNITYPTFEQFIGGNIMPKGVPSLTSMPPITVASKLNITPENKQTAAGGLSPNSPQVKASNGKSKQVSNSSTGSSDSSGSSDTSHSAKSSGMRIAPAVVAAVLPAVAAVLLA
ncbi:hypothetical protein MSPP1_000898 [Malassezia sp. CBS 17886]|nr:hypothetical protein MSPP1_000898 [Malassezia sp. CBS 17886]